MKIQLVRESAEIAKEIELVNVFPADEVRRFAFEALFGYFDTDGTRCWPKPRSSNASETPHEARIIGDDSKLLHTYGLRDMANHFRLEILSRKPEPN